MVARARAAAARVEVARAAVMAAARERCVERPDRAKEAARPLAAVTEAERVEARAVEAEVARVVAATASRTMAREGLL